MRDHSCPATNSFCFGRSSCLTPVGTCPMAIPTKTVTANLDAFIQSPPSRSAQNVPAYDPVGLADFSFTSTPFIHTRPQFGHLVGTSAVPMSSDLHIGHEKTSGFDILHAPRLLTCSWFHLQRILDPIIPCQPAPVAERPSEGGRGSLTMLFFITCCRKLFREPLQILREGKNLILQMVGFILLSTPRKLAPVINKMEKTLLRRRQISHVLAVELLLVAWAPGRSKVVGTGCTAGLVLGVHLLH